MSVIDCYSGPRQGRSGPKQGRFERTHAIVVAPTAAGAVTVHGAHRGPVRRPLGEMVTRAVRRRVRAWLARRAIESLKSLDDRMLQDIGLYRSDIEAIVCVDAMRHW